MASPHPQRSASTVETEDLLRAVLGVIQGNSAEYAEPPPPLSIDQGLCFYAEHLLRRNRSKKHRNEALASCREAALFLGAEYVHEISAHGLARWRMRWVEMGRSMTTAKRRAALVATWIQYLADYHRPDLEALRLPPFTIREADLVHPRRPFTEREVQSYLRASILIDEMDRNRRYVEQTTFYLFLMESGPRLGEALGASWQDVNLSEQWFRIVASRTKSRRGRIIPISSTVAERLLALRRRVESLDLPTGSADPVFWGSQGRGRLCSTPARLRHRRNLSSCGMSHQDRDGYHLDLHALRSTAATRAIETRALTDSEASSLLGHSDPKVTQRHYIKHRPAILSRGLDNLPPYAALTELDPLQERSPNGQLPLPGAQEQKN